MIFEKENRIGGRVHTSKDPPGEHGPQFVLATEKDTFRVLRDLKIKVAPAGEQWPAYRFRSQYVFGNSAEPKKAVKVLLAPESAKQLSALFTTVKKGRWPKTKKSFAEWLTTFSHDKDLVRFVKMLVISETCCPPECLSTQYALECLGSLFDDEWFRVRSGTVQLVKGLSKASAAELILNARVTRVKSVSGEVRVSWTENTNRRSEVFDAAVITDPRGDRLVGKSPGSRFRGYLSVLLEYRACPRIRGEDKINLAHGLYTDGPLNYMYLATSAKHSYVLRILIPNAGAKLNWNKAKVISYCNNYLEPILTTAGTHHASSVRAWNIGLPCGGNNREFSRITNRIYLAGDKFGKWPSMDAAIRSGRLAAEALAERLPGRIFLAAVCNHT